MKIDPKYTPELDPKFVSPALWNEAFEKKVAQTPGKHRVDIALTRRDGTCFRWSGELLPEGEENDALNFRYVERILKFLLWMKGGCTVMVAGAQRVADQLSKTYCKGGEREFDWNFIGKLIYDQPIEIVKVASEADLPQRSSAPFHWGATWMVIASGLIWADQIAKLLRS